MQGQHDHQLHDKVKTYGGHPSKASFYGMLAIGLGLIFLALILSEAAFAAGERSWSQKPAWASSQSGTTYSQRPNRLARKKKKAVTPFSPGSNNVRLDIGQVFLMGDLAERYPDNIGGQIHYTYGVSDLFGFDASLGYSSHGDADLSMTTMLVGLRTNLSWYDKIIPHVIAGLGFYKPSHKITEDPTNPTTISPVLFGLHLGPGIDLQLTDNFFFGTAVTFHDIFGATRFTPGGKPITVGGTYTTFFLHTGATF